MTLSPPLPTKPKPHSRLLYCAHMRVAKTAAVVLGFVLVGGVAACGGSTDSSDSIRSEHVSKATFAGTWPVIVEAGTLACDMSKGGSITFSPDGSTDVYAENGTAMGWAPKEGWKDFHDIWLTAPAGPGQRVDSGDFDAEGHKLCGDDTAAPAAASTSTSTVDASAQPLPPAADAPLRGFMAKPAYWDQAFGAATPADCTAEGFNGMTPIHAWRLPRGALACAGDPELGAWDSRVVNLTVYFDPAVNAQTALNELATIFPADNQLAGTNVGHNSATSEIPGGTCEDAVFTSDALRAAVTRVLPSWTGDPRKSAVTLYSGNSTSSDGSDSPFQPSSVRQALIGLSDGPDQTGC